MKITLMDQINMIMKHANRNGITILSFEKRKYDSVMFAKTNSGRGYLTIFCFIKDAFFKFTLV